MFCLWLSIIATDTVSHRLEQDISISLPNTLAAHRRLSASFVTVITTWQLQPGEEDQTQILSMFIFYYSFQPAASSTPRICVPLLTLLRPWDPIWYPSNCLCRTTSSSLEFISFSVLVNPCSVLCWLHHRISHRLHDSPVRTLVHDRAWCGFLPLRCCFLLVWKELPR